MRFFSFSCLCLDIHYELAPLNSDRASFSCARQGGREEMMICPLKEINSTPQWMRCTIKLKCSGWWWRGKRGGGRSFLFKTKINGCNLIEIYPSLARKMIIRVKGLGWLMKVSLPPGMWRDMKGRKKNTRIAFIHFHPHWLLLVGVGWTIYTGRGDAMIAPSSLIVSKGLLLLLQTITFLEYLSLMKLCSFHPAPHPCRRGLI